MTLRYKICLFAVKLFKYQRIKVDCAELLSLSIGFEILSWTKILTLIIQLATINRSWDFTLDKNLNLDRQTYTRTHVWTIRMLYDLMASVHGCKIVYKNVKIYSCENKSIYSIWLLISSITGVKNEPQHDKTNKMSVRPAKTQISLGICPVWSETSLPTWRNLRSLLPIKCTAKTDQTGQMPRLIRVFAGRTVTLLVLSCRGSKSQNKNQYSDFHFLLRHCLTK